MRFTAIVLGVAAVGCAAEDGAPEPRVLASAQGAVSFIATDRDAVYWSGDGGVRRLGVGDGELRWIGDGAPSLALAVAAERVFWATGDRVVWAPLEGGPVREIAADQRCVFAMATDGRRVFWASVIDGTIWAWDSVTERRWAIAGDQRNPTSIAVDGGRVYWTTGDGRVVSALPDGSEPRFLAEDQPWLSTLAVDGDQVYVASYDGSIRRIEGDGAAIAELVDGAPLSSFSAALAADRGDLYWVTAGPASDTDGEVRFFDHDRVAIETISVDRATAIAAGEDAIYWATATGDLVARAKGHGDAN